MQSRDGILFAVDNRTNAVSLGCPVCHETEGSIQGTMTQKRFTNTVVQADKLTQIETEGEDWMTDKTGIVMVNVIFLCKQGHSTTVAFRGRTGEVEVVSIWKGNGND